MHHMSNLFSHWSSIAIGILTVLNENHYIYFTPGTLFGKDFFHFQFQPQLQNYDIIVSISTDHPPVINYQLGSWGLGVGMGGRGGPSQRQGQPIVRYTDLGGLISGHSLKAAVYHNSCTGIKSCSFYYNSHQENVF